MSAQSKGINLQCNEPCRTPAETRGNESASPALPYQRGRGAIMARKLKTTVTNPGFFEPALAAPSMKAALEAWAQRLPPGLRQDLKIVAAAMARPGMVLRRPVGTRGAFDPKRT